MHFNPVLLFEHANKMVDKGETEYITYLAFQTVLCKCLSQGTIKKTSGVEQGKAAVDQKAAGKEKIGQSSNTSIFTA